MAPCHPWSPVIAFSATGARLSSSMALKAPQTCWVTIGTREVLRSGEIALACWEEFEPLDPTWLWADGLAEMVNALREKRQPLHSLEQDLHLLEVIEASTRAAREKRAIAVQSRFQPLDLQSAGTAGPSSPSRSHAARR